MSRVRAEESQAEVRSGEQSPREIERFVEEQQYQHGFVTEIESELAPKGLSEEIIRFISAKKEEPAWLL